MKVWRMEAGDEEFWLTAVATLISNEDRDHHLISDAETWSAVRDGRNYMLVASDGGKPVGLLTAFRFPDLAAGGDIVYLYDIEVSRLQRKQGIGNLLIKSLISHCEDDDVTLIWGGTAHDNKPAIKTFESTGAVISGHHHVEYEWAIEDDEGDDY